MQYIFNYQSFINEQYNNENNYENNDETVFFSEVTTKKGFFIYIKAAMHKNVNNAIAVQAFESEQHYLGNKRDIAHVQFRNIGNNTYYAMNAVTNNDIQKNGIMTELYNFVENKFGIKIIPSKDQEPDGIEFWKKRSLKESVEPIDNGVILIMTKPFPTDGLKRIYMNTIENVRIENNSKTSRVQLNSQYYILKDHNGIILPETVMMDNKYKKLLLNMNTNGLYLNEKKTPLWQISSETNIRNFFMNYQKEIKELKEKCNIIYPITQSKNKPIL